MSCSPRKRTLKAWYGKLKNARELTRRAMDSAQHNEAKEAAAMLSGRGGAARSGIGQPGAGTCRSQCGIEAGPEPRCAGHGGAGSGAAGDTARAEKLAAELDKTFPLDTLVQRYWLPTIRAAVALERKDPNRAIELLKVASTIELGEPTQRAVFLCPVYLRGEAYLMLHDGNAAAAEFQKFVDHRGLVVNFPWGALARLGLARAYALQGDPSKPGPHIRISLPSGKTPTPTSPS